MSHRFRQRGGERPPRRASGAQRPKNVPRAARGANRAAVLRVLSERSGMSVSELATASGIKRPVLYALLSKLAEAGEVAKEPLPGGTTGYSLQRSDAAASAEPADGRDRERSDAG
jgi:DNA-binding transcriptional ArsR family regulator